MIIDVQRFIEQESPKWRELETLLDAMERDEFSRLELPRVLRFHELYERVSADLARIATFVSEQETRTYLEALVGRAYGQIHETREGRRVFHFGRWLVVTLPRTFRRHRRAFQLAVAALAAGAALGAFAVGLDAPASKQIVLPFRELWGGPQERVAAEETRVSRDRLSGIKAQGAAWYMANNTQVALRMIALGATWGIGTLIDLFGTGAMVGAVFADYVAAGKTKFVLGWLLPHGSVEIPAILMAGQAGLVLAGALIGRGRRAPLRERMRRVGGDLVTLIGGIIVLLVWAGAIEAFLSQYHEPVLPYSLKIGVGCAQLGLLALWLGVSGRRATPGDENRPTRDAPAPSSPIRQTSTAKPLVIGHSSLDT